MRKYLILLLLAIATIAKAQDDDEYWKSWNKNYPPGDIPLVLQHERLYADSVEKHRNIAPYYFAKASYRFNATFLAQVKKIDNETLASIKRVLKLTVQKDTPVDEIFKQMVLMKIGDVQIWMPIQEKILMALKEEASKNDEVLLYCLFLNEHTSKNVLYNHFLISEFIKD
ncbi:hypothetical protein ACFQZS_11910 [Mucilaginibacter calamicampi]|uniref:Uncharacterized protein n=1 Tax=Mucilaginibacter calamicampi TaxID=1302352 RepID=A0ABW2YZ02_9SPHI